MDNANIITAADMADGHPFRFAAVRATLVTARWIGRCKACKAGVRLDGSPVMACERVYAGNGAYAASAQGFACTAVVDTAGKVHTTRILNDHSIVTVKCACGSWATAKMVRDAGKPDSKRHVCGSRCTHSTGPNCDCRCKGANHGSGL